MNELQQEISELKQFIIDLKADRAAQKEKEKREAWTKYVSLTVVIVAVIAAIASQWAGKFGGRVQMSQAQASDQWSYYQAKSIKQHLDETTLAQLSHAADPNDAIAAAAIAKLRADLGRYEQEKTEIKARAEALEKARDDAGKRSGKMATAISLFTVAIATASICTVTKRKPLWFVSLLLAGLGLFYAITAWTI